MKGFALVELPDGATASAEVHWYEAHGRGRRELKIKRILERRSDTRSMDEIAANETRPTFVVCLDDGGHPLSLQPRKVYRALPDPVAESHRMLRVVDDTGEDYLFPASLFAPVS